MLSKNFSCTSFSSSKKGQASSGLDLQITMVGFKWPQCTCVWLQPQQTQRAQENFMGQTSGSEKKGKALETFRDRQVCTR
mmetsp:Transcript_135441/g.234952  ORF Transcript_135441/g.234952 Transcript_135441/m.234952 type:complete len:80 (-) Transcript_135441:405-644(-)